MGPLTLLCGAALACIGLAGCCLVCWGLYLGYVRSLYVVPDVFVLLFIVALRGTLSVIFLLLGMRTIRYGILKIPNS